VESIPGVSGEKETEGLPARLDVREDGRGSELDRAGGGSGDVTAVVGELIYW
jgi:hypothetical protein